jgi:uncharacterized membrane-anchored protein YitT (DUF2179 family)
MFKTKKFVIFNLIVAIICVVLYLVLIPHNVEVNHYVTEFSDTTVTTIPLSTKKMILEASVLFITLSIPTIILGIRKISKRLFLGENSKVK